jgi:hypothetical protein
MSRTTTDSVLRVRHQLTDRDWRLLGWLHDHRVLTSFQIAKALFPSLNFAQRRLGILTDLGVLARFRPLRMAGGTYPYHYVLAHTGALLIAGTRGERPPRPSETTVRLQRIASSRNLDHRLGINDFFVDLAAHERTHPGAVLHAWWPDTRLVAFSPPGSFAYGTVRADALGLWTEHGQTVAFYLEHDTGTENLTVLTDKLAGYRDLVRRGGPAWPLLFWLHSAAREVHLHDRLTDNADARWFPIATAARDRLHDQSPAEAIWQLHGHGPPRRLAELPMRDLVDPAVFSDSYETGV